MSLNPQNVTGAMDDFVRRYMTRYQQQHQQLPQIAHDEEWPSPCELQPASNGERVSWQPSPCTDKPDFADVEQALALSLHPDLKAWFTSYYSDGLTGTFDSHPVELLLPWNRRDFERLQENIIGHVLMKRRLKQAVTVFIGLTADDDVIISMLNDSGEIWLERVGREPHFKLADNLVDFLARTVAFG